MRGIHTKIGAALALSALGALAGYTVGAGSADQPPAATAGARAPVEVRTETVHRTVRVVKHPKRRHVKRPQPAAAAPPVQVAAVPQSTPAVPPAAGTPRNSAPPVRTRTSGGASPGGSEDEHERGEEREGGDD